MLDSSKPSSLPAPAASAKRPREKSSSSRQPDYTGSEQSLVNAIASKGLAQGSFNQPLEFDDTEPISTLIQLLEFPLQAMKPMVARGLGKFVKDSKILKLSWLMANQASSVVDVRNQITGTDETMKFKDFISEISEQPVLLPHKWRAKCKRVLYGKDLQCPQAWMEEISSVLPAQLTYLGSNDYMRMVAPSESQSSIFMSENMMLYIGPDSSFTPGHVDLCGSVGHNLMVDATSPKAGAVWYFCSPDDKVKFAKFWESRGASMFSDDYFCPRRDLQKAGFKVYYTFQRPGDLVIIPPDTPHQVVNYGGVTVKIAWNRISSQSLELCSRSLLRLYAICLKPPIFQIQVMAHAALLQFMKTMRERRMGILDYQMGCEFKKIISIFETLVANEWIDLAYLREKYPLCQDSTLASKEQVLSREDVLPYEMDGETVIQCDICQSYIWNRGMSCDGQSDPCDLEDSHLFDNSTPTWPRSERKCDICLVCYAAGRSCQHPRRLRMHAKMKMSKLMADLQQAVDLWNNVSDTGPKIQTKPFISDPVVSDATVAFERMLKLTGRLEITPAMCHICNTPSRSGLMCSIPDCRRSFCSSCLWKRYQIRAYHIYRIPAWACNRCRSDGVSQQIGYEETLLSFTGASKSQLLGIQTMMFPLADTALPSSNNAPAADKTPRKRLKASETTTISDRTESS
ncbi:uncharacterized protein BJ171DRAFT_596213 [Polychytrium aggregatum]|uniref:uncharacterized protein n=1 Tax=Polychytrium aggregatum TaxID=110093 RepID=UPI0022FE1429|nr:uncharacterized protein BJ171DRAFT_596213 [Polychytrium aggregatum]KAI9207771.1 hypothetical protein BJ171DRAFT_596213 [Polychytrium aggregatum]